MCSVGLLCLPHPDTPCAVPKALNRSFWRAGSSPGLACIGLRAAGPCRRGCPLANAFCIRARSKRKPRQALSSHLGTEPQRAAARPPAWPHSGGDAADSSGRSGGASPAKVLGPGEPPDPGALARDTPPLAKRPRAAWGAAAAHAGGGCGEPRAAAPGPAAGFGLGASAFAPPPRAPFLARLEARAAFADADPERGTDPGPAPARRRRGGILLAPAALRAARLEAPGADASAVAAVALARLSAGLGAGAASAGGRAAGYDLWADAEAQDHSPEASSDAPSARRPRAHPAHARAPKRAAAGPARAARRGGGGGGGGGVRQRAAAAAAGALMLPPAALVPQMARPAPAPAAHGTPAASGGCLCACAMTARATSQVHCSAGRSEAPRLPRFTRERGRRRARPPWRRLGRPDDAPLQARGGGALPAGLARSFVLVAKTLTRSDTNGRVILPRVSVEANLTFLVGYKRAAPGPGYPT